MAQSFALDVDALLPVLDYLNLGVYITDTDRRIRLWNRKAEEITGHRAADVVGRACHDNVLVHIDKDGHPLCKTQFCPLYRSMALNKESRQSLLIYAQKADGSRVAVSVSTAPLRDNSGKVIGGIETFRDETAQVRDLEFARKIQRHMLPQAVPDVPGFAFDVRYYPHELVGGDFYDIRAVGPRRFGFMVADVRGHGVSAALYTMWLKMLEENFHDLGAKPDRFLSAMNREMSRFVLDESFATALYGVLNVKRHEVAFASAGHPAPLHFHAASGDVTACEAHGMPLGIVADGDYDSATAALEPGDLLLCYTDGVTEAVDRQGRMIGEKGLAELLKRLMSPTSRDLVERLYRRVKRQCGDVTLSDDVLLLSLRRQPDA